MKYCALALLLPLAVVVIAACGESSTGAVALNGPGDSSEPQASADSPGQVATTQPKTESALASVNRTYAALLKDVVTPDGLVRYDVLGESPRRRSLQEIVAAYAKTDLPPGDDEKLAFLCNAYNVNVLKMVIGATAKEDLTSVMDIPGFFDTLSITVAGKQMTLNALENEQIRPMGDPRIHAALVCAAMSCPPLRGEPYTAKQLDKQLNDQSRRWINNPNQNGIDEHGLGVSMIMQWYGDDFSVEPYGGVVGFVRAFAEPAGPIERWLSHEDEPQVHFLKYDWRLNRARPG
ncbi:MAG: DUF547 domain-containing protein [Phycisphaerales bacterium]